MTSLLHRIAGVFSLLLIALFFVSSVTVEVFGDHNAVALVKSLILIGVCVLVPAMAATGVTGRLRARGRGGPVIRAKKTRTAIIAAIGLLILIPCAVTLRQLSASGDFSATFTVVQAVELAGGAVNIVLMSINVRAGMIMTGRLRKKRAGSARRASGRLEGSVSTSNVEPTPRP